MKISNDAQAVIYKQEDEKTFFLLLYRHNPDKNIDEYRLVKGGVKKDEAIENAVKREVGEEVGLKNIEVVSRINEYSYVAGEVQHNVHIFLIKALDANIKIDSSEEGAFEIKGSRWVSTEEAISLLSFADEKKAITNSLEKIG